MIAFTIIAVFVIIGVTAAVIIINLAKTELKKAEIERNAEVAKKALSNEVLRVAINDIDIKVPWVEEKEYIQEGEKDAYRRGYQKGAAKVRDEAKKIIQNTRGEWT